jgi:hypothetical protein
MSVMRLIRAILAASILASMLVLPSARASDCQPLSFQTFEVDSSARAKVYRLGDTALVDVQVSREATGSPVEGAKVFVLLDWGSDDGFLAAKPRITDDEGKVTAKLPLHRDLVKPGAVTLMTYAVHDHLDSRVCGDVTEYGHEVERRAFRVRS